MVMRTTLSKKEFASALGMSDTDVFVLKMFNIVDRDGDGRISFQEFLDTIVLFSKVWIICKHLSASYIVYDAKCTDKLYLAGCLVFRFMSIFANDPSSPD